MRKLILGFSLIFLFASCVDNQELFIPDMESGPDAYIKEILTSESIHRTLNTGQNHELVSDSDTRILLPDNILNPEEAEEYTLQFIEVKDYSDYILHGIDHEAKDGAVHAIYSFYIALEEDDKIQALNNKEFIELRIPHEQLMENVLLGKGDYESGKLIWYYNNSQLNSNVSFTEWEVEDLNGNSRVEYGFSVRVSNAGWYSLVNISNSNFDYNSVCLQFDPVYDASNTVVYLLSDFNTFASRLDFDASGAMCSEYLPFEQSGAYKLISISEIEGQLYFYKGLVDTNSGVISVNPQKISASDLKEEISAL